jgi:hypothetical protein
VLGPAQVKGIPVISWGLPPSGSLVAGWLTVFSGYFHYFKTLSFLLLPHGSWCHLHYSQGGQPLSIWAWPVSLMRVIEAWDLGACVD